MLQNYINRDYLTQREIEPNKYIKHIKRHERLCLSHKKNNEQV
jgi:hypothetical protein